MGADGDHKREKMTIHAIRLLVVALGSIAIVSPLAAAETAAQQAGKSLKGCEVNVMPSRDAIVPIRGLSRFGTLASASISAACQRLFNTECFWDTKTCLGFAWTAGGPEA